MGIRYELTQLLEGAAREAQARSILPAQALPEVILEHPQNPAFGDYACSLPMKLARAARMDPMSLGQALAQLLPSHEAVARVEVAPPGFINFTLAAPWLALQVEAMLKAGMAYGDLDVGHGERLQVEFVSINPTGPLHVGHGRGAVLGDTLARALGAAGFQVETEYYVNDGGNQMEAFYTSLYVRYLQALGQKEAMPDSGYMGSYMMELARELLAERGDALLALPREEAIAQAGRWGLERVLGWIREDLERLGVSFDSWFSEHSLYREGQYERAMGILSQGGFTAEREGALWFISTALGEDKDNVLVRTSGIPTYFASDIAYHYNKFLERGFQRVIDIWGADHQGHVPRMKAAVAALGVAPERLQIILNQMVALRRGEEVLRVSKRTGELITLGELMDEVGADACRFFYLARSADAQMDFDLELAKRQSAENPVYYIQYAHARIASILLLAQGRSIDYASGDVSLLTTEPELALLRKIIQLPEVVETVARTLEPHHLAYYAQELAMVFHLFYRDCRVVTQDVALTRARLKLVEAARLALAKTLYLMGMSAPDKM
ncbi:MAG: arginine--tRNA ligase [Chloroflexi bacterium]|nr:arginine--tRNA ligase [Chloroflexota bacterium]